MALTATAPAARGACGPRGLPPDRHFVNEGHCARVVAHRQGALRSITFAESGDLLAVTGAGEIRRYRDVDRDGLFAEGAPETVAWARAEEGARTCQFDGHDLYCSSRTRVKRWHYSPDSDHGGPGEDVVAGLPDAREPGHAGDGALAVSGGWLHASGGAGTDAAAGVVSDSGEDPVRPLSVAVSPVGGALFVATNTSTSNSAAPATGSLYRISLLGK